MLVSIDELQNEYNELLQRMRPTPHRYSFLTERTDDGSPHVEVCDRMYHFVTTERGLEISRKSFESKEDLLFEIVSLDTFWMGVDFEFKNRVENLDCRRMIFAKQLELMNLIDSEWAKRCALKIEATLAEHPYVDR